MSDDDSEREVDARGKTTQEDFQGLEDPQVQAIVRNITGKTETIYSYGVQFKDVAGLETVLNDLEQRRNFPIILGVDTLTKGGPFYGQYRDDRMGVDYGGHYVTVWDIDKEGRVLVDDQFGREYDRESLRRVKLDVLFVGAVTDEAVREAIPMQKLLSSYAPETRKKN